MHYIKHSLIILCLILGGCSVADRLEETTPLIADFQALYNVRSFSAMYDDMVHAEWHDIDDTETFAKNLNKVRNLTGERISGKRINFNWKSTTGTGTTVVVMYETKFINGTGYETFTFRSEGEVLKLLGYNFQAGEGFNANQADAA